MAEVRVLGHQSSCALHTATFTAPKRCPFPSMMRLSLCLVSGILFYTLTAQARFVVEQSALKIKFPTSGRQAHPDGFDMSLANFGAPQYGGSLVYVPLLLASVCPPDHSPTD